MGKKTQPQLNGFLGCFLFRFQQAVANSAPKLTGADVVRHAGFVSPSEVVPTELQTFEVQSKGLSGKQSIKLFGVFKKFEQNVCLEQLLVSVHLASSSHGENKVKLKKGWMALRVGVPGQKKRTSHCKCMGLGYSDNEQHKNSCGLPLKYQPL